MGWIASRDTATQVRLQFVDLNEAIAFAEKQGFEYTVAQPKQKIMKKKSYSDNFRYRPDNTGEAGRELVTPK